MPEIVRNFRMSPSVWHYYNVSLGVGANRRNEPHDVLLVQFLLNQLRTRPGHRFANPPLVTDGLFGPKTRAVIGAFQASWNRVGRSGTRPRVDEDSVISPGRGRTRPGNRTWTILALNALVGNDTATDNPDQRSGVGIDMYCRLHTHPECPPRLRAFFMSAPGRVPLSAIRPSALRGSGPAASNHADRLGPAPVSVRSRARPQTGAPRPYDITDPGVQWAARVLRPGRGMFTEYEWSEIMEMMQGAGDRRPGRWYILKDAVDLILGERFLSGFPPLSIAEAQELMRQQVALGPTRRYRRY